MIGRHAATGGEQVGKVVQAPVEPAVGGLAVMQRRLRQVAVAAPAMLQATAEHVVRHQAALLRGDTEPAPRQGCVLFDTTTVEQDLAKQRLRLDHPLPRCHQQGLGGLGRAVFEHFAELVAADHFFTA